MQGSGSGIYSLNVARELTKLGHEVMAIVPDHGPVDGYPFPVQSIVFSNGTNVSPELNFNFPCFTTHPVSSTTFYELTDSQLDAYLNAWRRAMRQAGTDLMGFKQGPRYREKTLPLTPTR